MRYLEWPDLPPIKGYSVEFVLKHDGVPTCVKKTLSLEGLTPTDAYAPNYWSAGAGSGAELDALKRFRELLRDACALDGWTREAIIREAKKQ